MGRGGPRRGHGRVGIWYLLLFVGTVAAALWLARHFDLGAAATLVAVLPGLAPGYLGWAAFRADRAEAAAMDLETVAGHLAVAVRNQWEEETAVRRVNDPYPLPVAWRAAGEDLAEPWPLLTDLARAWPGGSPGDPTLWPQDAGGLAGQDAEIGAVFTDRVPTRRLVILGEPGSGKSVLLIRLLQDLIERRAASDPVPVLFTLASWNPEQRLNAWMADQLRRSYPGLRSPAPAAPTGVGLRDLAQALLDARLVLPLLDGFDELPAAVHTAALDALNRALPTRHPLILASRATEFRNALVPPVRLNGAAAIHLLPISPDTAAAYLRRDAGGAHTPLAARWDAVVTCLGTASPAGDALSTPLGLFLARTIYNPHTQDASAAAAAHPDKLCDTTAFPDRATIDTHLFNAYIPAVYATLCPPHPSRWTDDQAHRTLALLAQFLESRRAGSPDLAWWELTQVLPARIHRALLLSFGLLSGLSLGFAVGLGAGLVSGLRGGLVCGLPFGFVFALTAGRKAGANSRNEAASGTPNSRLRWKFSMFGLAVALAFGLLAGLAFSLVFGLTFGLAIGLTYSLVFAILVGLDVVKVDLTSNITPMALLSSDRRSFIVFVLALEFTVGLAIWLAAGLVFRFSVGLAIGLADGFSFALSCGLMQTAWPYFVLARGYLAMRREIPWYLMAFLQDAHEHRGVLRQVGPVYQFRHIDLQRHLAQQPLNASRPNP
jgi:NACHT domain